LVVVSILSIISYLPSRFDKLETVKVSNFPMKIGDWSATDMPLGENDYKALGTKNVIIRNYKNYKGDSIILYLVYSERNRQVSNPPETYYMGSGSTIVEKSVEQITPAIKAIKMIVEKSASRQMVVYWFKVGNLNTEKYIKQQLKIVTDQMLLKRTSGAMIRLSIDIKDSNENAAFKTLQLFTAQIEPLLQKYVP
jgi:EpsI family protein